MPSKSHTDLGVERCDTEPFEKHSRLFRRESHSTSRMPECDSEQRQNPSLSCSGVFEEYGCALVIQLNHTRNVVPVIFHDFDYQELPVGVQHLEHFKIDTRKDKDWAGFDDLALRLHDIPQCTLPRPSTGRTPLRSRLLSPDPPG